MFKLADIDRASDRGPRSKGPPQPSLDALLTECYGTLIAIANRELRRARNPRFLEASDVVHDVAIRLLGAHRDRIADAAHLCAVATLAIRQVIVDDVRRAAATRRGGGIVLRSLDRCRTGEPHAARRAPCGAMLRWNEPDSGPDELSRLSDVGDALGALEGGLGGARGGASARREQVLILHGAYGLTLRETALTLGVSRATVSREWSEALRHIRSGRRPVDPEAVASIGAAA